MQIKLHRKADVPESGHVLPAEASALSAAMQPSSLMDTSSKVKSVAAEI